MDYNELQADVSDYNDALDKAIADSKNAALWVESCKERLDKAVETLALYKNATKHNDL